MFVGLAHRAVLTRFLFDLLAWRLLRRQRWLLQRLVHSSAVVLLLCPAPAGTITTLPNFQVHVMLLLLTASLPECAHFALLLWVAVFLRKSSIATGYIKPLRLHVLLRLEAVHVQDAALQVCVE